MTLKVSKNIHTKFGVARGSRGRTSTKTLTQNFNASVDADADADADADTDADARARTIPLTSTLLRRGKNETIRTMKLLLQQLTGGRRT